MSLPTRPVAPVGMSPLPAIPRMRHSGRHGNTAEYPTSALWQLMPAAITTDSRPQRGVARTLPAGVYASIIWLRMA
jgi:hypothetical protein